MEHIVMQGIVDQPLCYSDWAEIEFVVHTLTEDEHFVHIKGDVGYLDTRVDTVKSEEHELKVSHYDGIDFYFAYEKSTHRMIVRRHYRKTTCDHEEYERFKDTWEYDDPDHDREEHFPYFRLLRSKDAVLIPHFVKALWKGNDTPLTYIPTKDWV
jgi:hypothetical protein